MIKPTIDDIIMNKDLAARIFFHLSREDALEASCVNKRWFSAVRNALTKRSVKIDMDFIDKVEDKNITLIDYIEKEYPYATDIEIKSWVPGRYVDSELFDTLFTSRLRAKRLTIVGRGEWASCRCPDHGSSKGEQYDNLKKEDLTNFEYIHIASPFQITACALLDLISRSPRLKTMRFSGRIRKKKHNRIFSNKRFYCDLNQLYCPWSDKKQISTLMMIVQRNENLTTLCSNAETTCDLLAADALPNLRYLSLVLNEDWNFDSTNFKKAYEYLRKTNYLSLAKKLEALEIRTFDLPYNEDMSDEARENIENLHENYKLNFWEQVSNIPNLKYLSIYGAWELGKVCRELQKHGIQVEYLKINLLPNSLMSALDAQDNFPVLSIANVARDIRKLPKLRSLHYACSEKLGNLDSKTVSSFKELIDLIWMLQIEIIFTDEVEDLLNNIMRRGVQVGKAYRILLHTQMKNPQLANILTHVNLRNTSGQSLKSHISSLLENNVSKSHGKHMIEKIHLWGLEQINHFRDQPTYAKLRQTWAFYSKIFEPTFVYL